MSSLDWPGLMRAGMHGLGLRPAEFWATYIFFWRDWLSYGESFLLAFALLAIACGCGCGATARGGSGLSSMAIFASASTRKEPCGYFCT